MEAIERFLLISSGFGFGDGDGSGFGYGDGDDLKAINGQLVYQIDNVPTLIYSLRNNMARGAIINSDMTLSPCYVAKSGNLYAHGDTLRHAIGSLVEKQMKLMDVGEKIAMFKEVFKDYTIKQPAKLLAEWHHRLTGSCATGIASFVANNGIDLEKDEFTIYEFIERTKNSYGSEIIKQLNTITP